ncbi:MAG: transposase [Immundisolibacter sp.]|uniref:REP-associated tyrosine transposase n=1 Tax=Immundisolibacter sp. TaxID=1934948 RepID=UPI0019927F14|nr:transposase [Immundisolibacter sp.]MBC7161953.1 transposase [Immundisolibacter sp.]
MRFASHRLRRGRVSEAGRAYLVTATTLQRRPVFADWTAARLLVSALRRENDCGAATTLAYVAMPDHLHWLMQLGEGVTLATVVGRVKSVVAHAMTGPIWQAGFHDHAVRADEDLARIARYLVLNPVRAGLVQRVGDYPHWDAIWL